MTLLTYRNADGKELAIGDGRLKLLSVEGLESPPVSLAVSTGPAVGGAIALSARNAPRALKVEALLDLGGLDEAQAAAAREAIDEALDDSRSMGVMEVTRAGRKRWIGARPSKAPKFGAKTWNERWQRVRTEFICPRPCFMDTELRKQTVQFYEAMTEFDETGIEFTEAGREISMILYLGMRVATISNPGNVESPVKIRFTGPIVNPYLKNQTTGEMLRIPHVIREGDYIEMETTPGKREIRLCVDGTMMNGMHYLDLASKFWQLRPGDNIVEVGDESPGEGSEASFEFYPHYREA